MVTVFIYDDDDLIIRLKVPGIHIESSSSAWSSAAASSDDGGDVFSSNEEVNEWSKCKSRSGSFHVSPPPSPYRFDDEMFDDVGLESDIYLSNLFRLSSVCPIFFGFLIFLWATLVTEKTEK